MHTVLSLASISRYLPQAHQCTKVQTSSQPEKDSEASSLTGPVISSQRASTVASCGSTPGTAQSNAPLLRPQRTERAGPSSRLLEQDAQKKPGPSCKRTRAAVLPHQQTTSPEAPRRPPKQSQPIPGPVIPAAGLCSASRSRFKKRSSEGGKEAKRRKSSCHKQSALQRSGASHPRNPPFEVEAPAAGAFEARSPRRASSQAAKKAFPRPPAPDLHNSRASSASSSHRGST